MSAPWSVEGAARAACAKAQATGVPWAREMAEACIRAGLERAAEVTAVRAKAHADYQALSRLRRPDDYDPSREGAILDEAEACERAIRALLEERR